MPDRLALDYVRRKRDFLIAKRTARRNHPQPCDCPYCLTPARAHELLAQRVAAQRERVGEAPF